MSDQDSWEVYEEIDPNEVLKLCKVVYQKFEEFVSDGLNNVRTSENVFVYDPSEPPSIAELSFQKAYDAVWDNDRLEHYKRDLKLDVDTPDHWGHIEMQLTFSFYQDMGKLGATYAIKYGSVISANCDDLILQIITSRDPIKARFYSHDSEDTVKNHPSALKMIQTICSHVKGSIKDPFDLWYNKIDEEQFVRDHLGGGEILITKEGDWYLVVDDAVYSEEHQLTLMGIRKVDYDEELKLAKLKKRTELESNYFLNNLLARHLGIDTGKTIGEAYLEEESS